MGLIREFCSEMSVEITNIDELFPAGLQRLGMISSVIPPPLSFSSTGWRDKLPRPRRRREGSAAICGSVHRVFGQDGRNRRTVKLCRQTDKRAHTHTPREKSLQRLAGASAQTVLWVDRNKSCVGADECVEQGWVDWVDWVVGASGESSASTQPLYK